MNSMAQDTLRFCAEHTFLANMIIFGWMFILAGCAATPKEHKYSWGRIVRVDANALAAFCSSNSGQWDDGTDRPRWAPVSGCFDPQTGDIWIEDSCAGAKALLHELAHQDGVEKPANEGFEWE